MAMSERINRGFHRLGLFLAAIIVLIGASFWLNLGVGETSYQGRHNEALVCAHEILQKDPKRFWDLDQFKWGDVANAADDWS
jgi:hypothetical protein